VVATVTSHVNDFPFCHGIRVNPSGRLPSLRESPVGSFIAGTPAKANAREMILLLLLLLYFYYAHFLLLLVLVIVVGVVVVVVVFAQLLVFTDNCHRGSILMLYTVHYRTDIIFPHLLRSIF